MSKLDKELLRKVYKEFINSKHLRDRLGIDLRKNVKKVFGYADDLYTDVYEPHLVAMFKEWSMNEKNLLAEFKDPEDKKLTREKHIEALEQFVLRLQQIVLIYEGCLFTMNFLLDNGWLLSLHNPSFLQSQEK